MSYWICCNSCFISPSADCRLAVTTCGHVICNVCYQKGMPDRCLICQAKCHVSPLSDKSTPEVKALFSDINLVANKHFTEISKVLMFQTRHQKRLLTHYQETNEKLEDAIVKMKQEMQQMAKMLNEQSAYISKLENSLQHQSAKTSSVSQMRSRTPQGHKSVVQIPYNSPVCLSRRSSTVAENMGLAERRKTNTDRRLSLISPPLDGRMGTIPHRSSNLNTMSGHSVSSATVSHFNRTTMTPLLSYDQSSAWKSPIFKPPPSFKHPSMSSLVYTPPLTNTRM